MDRTNDPRAPALPSPPTWVLVLRGGAALAFGAGALVWPGATLLALVALFAAFALLSGAAAVVGALRRRGGDGWKLELALGIVSLLAGGLAIFNPAITALAFVLLMGVNAIVGGAIDIATGIRLRKAITGEWLMILAGVVSIVFGALVVAVPQAGAYALVWIVAVWALVSGVLLPALAWRQRRWEREHRGGTPAAAH